MCRTTGCAWRPTRAAQSLGTRSTWGSRRALTPPGATRRSRSTSSAHDDLHHGLRRYDRPMAAARTAGPRPRKALGQHFLRDSGVLADIVAAVRVPPGGLIVEIGAGTGQLTSELLAAGHEVIALEIEERLLAHLRKRFAGETRLRIVSADARDVDYGQLVPSRREFVVVGNLPYFAANP